MNTLRCIEKLTALYHGSINRLEKRVNRALFLLVFLGSLNILLISCAGLEGDRGISQGRHDYHINKADDFRLRLEKITRATYGILSLTFYGHPLNNQKGVIVISSGVGYLVKNHGKPVIVTAYHVLNSEDDHVRDIFGYSLSFEKIAGKSFVLSNKKEIFLVIQTLKEYLIKKDGGGGIVDKSVYDGIFGDLKAQFSQSWQIARQNQASDRQSGIAFAVISDSGPVDSVPVDYLEEYPEIRLGKQVGVYGFPNSFGAHYREGVISKITSFDFKKGRLSPFTYHTDIILAEGDSGAPVLSTSNDGKLRIFGMVLAAMSNQPRLGKVLSSEYIRKKIDAEAFVEKW